MSKTRPTISFKTLVANAIEEYQQITKRVLTHKMCDTAIMSLQENLKQENMCDDELVEEIKIHRCVVAVVAKDSFFYNTSHFLNMTKSILPPDAIMISHEIKQEVKAEKSWSQLPTQLIKHFSLFCDVDCLNTLKLVSKNFKTGLESAYYQRLKNEFPGFESNAEIASFLKSVKIDLEAYDSKNQNAWTKKAYALLCRFKEGTIEEHKSPYDFFAQFPRKGFFEDFSHAKQFPISNPNVQMKDFKSWVEACLAKAPDEHPLKKQKMLFENLYCIAVQFAPLEIVVMIFLQYSSSDYEYYNILDFPSRMGRTDVVKMLAHHYIPRDQYKTSTWYITPAIAKALASRHFRVASCLINKFNLKNRYTASDFLCIYDNRAALNFLLDTLHKISGSISAAQKVLEKNQIWILQDLLCCFSKIQTSDLIEYYIKHSGEKINLTVIRFLVAWDFSITAQHQQMLIEAEKAMTSTLIGQVERGEIPQKSYDDYIQAISEIKKYMDEKIMKLDSAALKSLEVKPSL